MALKEGRKDVSWGFRNPADGWHTFSFQEGIQLSINEKTGKESLRVPMAVEEGSDDDGCRVTAFINTHNENREPYKQAEQNIADIITNAGLFEAFSAKFADADSWLDKRIIDAMALKLPGVQVMAETKVQKDQSGNDRCNVMGWAPKGTKKEPKKGAAVKAEKKAAAAVPSEW